MDRDSFDLISRREKVKTVFGDDRLLARNAWFPGEALRRCQANAGPEISMISSYIPAKATSVYIYR
jgi:hypothetical protein